ncbi:MAG: hypothetical protein ACREPX_08275 [Rhodanobacteraceae bacterium]
MTTNSTNTVIAHSSDATFRTWVAEFIAQCLAVGLTQTSDTGQINTSTVNRPGTNTDGGYAVFRFNDTLQATAPIFLKFYFGTAGTATTPRIRIQHGTASDGAGTVSGLGSVNTENFTNATAPGSTVTLYPSHFCYSATLGVFCFSWKFGGRGTGLPQANYIGGRSSDSTGAPTGDAYAYVTSTGGSTAWTTARSISYLSSTIYLGSDNFWLVHYGLSASVVGGVPQAFKTYYVTPRVRPWMAMLVVVDAEITRGTTFTDTVVGTTSHTYLNAAGSVSNWGAGMLWE